MVEKQLEFYFMERAREEERKESMLETAMGILGFGLMTLSYVLYPKVGPAIENYITRIFN